MIYDDYLSDTEKYSQKSRQHSNERGNEEEWKKETTAISRSKAVCRAVTALSVSLARAFTHIHIC